MRSFASTARGGSEGKVLRSDSADFWSPGVSPIGTGYVGPIMPTRGAPGAELE